jgi:hypothetical protein
VKLYQKPYKVFFSLLPTSSEGIHDEVSDCVDERGEGGHVERGMLQQPMGGGDGGGQGRQARGVVLQRHQAPHCTRFTHKE